MRHKGYLSLLVIMTCFSLLMSSLGGCNCASETPAQIGLDSEISYQTVDMNKQTLTVDITCDAFSADDQDACFNKQLCAKASWFTKTSVTPNDEDDENVPKLDQVTECFTLSESSWDTQNNSVYKRSISITSSKAVLPEAKTAAIRLSLPEPYDALSISTVWTSVGIE